MRLNKENKEKTCVINDCVSKSIVNDKSNLSLKKLYAIPNHTKLVGNIANHTTAKDLFTLVDVLDQIVNVYKRTDIYFIQIGEFSKRTDKIKNYATKKGVLQYLVFLDKYANAALLNPQFDCFLLTSEREGGPTSVLEAMMFETPVVSTQVGFVNEVVVNGENGFTAKPKDYKTLANGVIEIVDNTELQNSFTTLNKKIVEEQFTAHYIAEQTQKKYTKVLNS